MWARRGGLLLAAVFFSFFGAIALRGIIENPHVLPLLWIPVLLLGFGLICLAVLVRDFRIKYEFPAEEA
jgi:hypothetical protein